MNKGCQGEALTQREACSASETRQNSRWLSCAPDLLHDPDFVSSRKSGRKKQRKKDGYVQVRLYLPKDISAKLLLLSPPLRNAILAARIRALSWDLNIDPIRLEEGLLALKESCVLVRQALQSSGGRECPRESIMDLVIRLEKVVQR